MAKGWLDNYKNIPQAQGGTEIDWDKVRDINNSAAIQTAKFFDPTGFSSWNDVYYAIDDYKKGKGSGLNVALNVLGALPVLGKLGRAAGTLSRSQKLAKATEKIVKVNKVLDKVEKVVPNIAKAIGRTSDIIAKGSRAGKANPVAVASKVVGKVAKGVEKVDTATRKFTGKVLDKIPGTEGDVGNIINSATSLLNIGNIASDTKSIIDASDKTPESNPLIDKTKTIKYYNTDPKRGEVEKPGQLADVQYVPIQNSVQLKKWKEQQGNLKNGGWLDNYNDSEVSLPEGFVGEGIFNGPKFDNPAWGGQFQMGGNLPGAVGNMYARTGDIPSEGPKRNKLYKTDASAQNGKEMQYYQQGLDWKPKSISKNGGWLNSYEDGGVVKGDQDGYRNPKNRGKVVEIQGGTMGTDGYGNRSLYVVPNVGEPRVVHANTGDHEFPGATKFTEYPMAQDGFKLDLSSLPKVSDFKKKKLEVEPEKNTVVKESTKVNKNIPTKVKQVKQFEPLDDAELAKLNVPDQVYSQIYQAQNDQPEQNYGIVDKENNVMYFVDTYGDIIGHENVITGATNKDKENAPSMKEYGKTANEYYDYLKNTNQRVTPAGIFTLHSNKNDSVGKPHSLVDRALSTLPFTDNVRLNTLDDPSLMHAIYNEMPWREEEKKEYYDHRKESYGPTGNMFRMVSQYGVPSSKGVHGTGNPNRISALNTPGADKNLSNGCINVGGRTICNDALKDKSKLYILPEKKYMFGSKEIATNKKDIYPAWGHTDDSGKYIPTKDRNISREDIQSAKATRDKVMGIIKKNKINATPEEIDFIAAVAEKETKGGKSWLSKAESILPGFSSYGLYEQKESFPYLNGKSPNDEAASTKAVLEFYRDKLYNNPDLEYDKFKNEEIYSMYNTGKENTDKGIHLGDEFRKILQSVKEYKNGGSINQQDQKTLQQLDQLTNFTNYNKPQPGGWLNKYN